MLKLDPAAKTAELAHKTTVRFDRALLATGANINRLRVEGGDHDGIHYLRTLGTSVSLREDAAEAERVVRSLLDPEARRYVPPFHIAMAYAGLGDRDAAFQWLDRGFAERASFMVGVKVERGFAGLHADPRWPRLLRRMGLDP